METENLIHLKTAIIRYVPPWHYIDIRYSGPFASKPWTKEHNRRLLAAFSGFLANLGIRPSQLIVRNAYNNNIRFWLAIPDGSEDSKILFDYFGSR